MRSFFLDDAVVLGSLNAKLLYKKAQECPQLLVAFWNGPHSVCDCRLEGCWLLATGMVG